MKVCTVALLPILVLAAGAVLAENAPARERAPCPPRDLVERWLSVFESRDLAEVDEVFAPDFTANGRPMSHEELKAAVGWWRSTFPDLEIVPGQWVCEGDTVALQYRARGTHGGAFAGIAPTGKHVEWSGIDIFRAEGGVLAEGWFVQDLLGLVEALGGSVQGPPAPAENGGGDHLSGEAPAPSDANGG
jgi:predicted ester cyclase